MSINWLRKIVNHPLPLRTSATVVMIQKDVGLITEYTVPPIHEVPPLVLTAPLPVKSPVLQCQHRASTGRGGRYPTVKILLMIHLAVKSPTKQSYHVHHQTKSRDLAVVPYHEQQVAFFPGSDCSSTTTTSPWAVVPFFRLCRRILLTLPCIRATRHHNNWGWKFLSDNLTVCCGICCEYCGIISDNDTVRQTFH